MKYNHRMLGALKEIVDRTKRSLNHEAGHALTAYDYGFGADEFLVEVANDPAGATYRGRIGIRSVSDEEIEKMDEAKKRCYGIVCAAGVAGEFVALGNIEQRNLHDGSKDRQLLARFTTVPLEEFIEDAKIVVGGRREVHRRVAEYMEAKFWEWIKAHPEAPDGLYTVLDRHAMGKMFAEVRDAANRLMDERYSKGDIRSAWITTWAHEAGHAVVAEHFGLPLQRVVIRVAPDGYTTMMCIYDWEKHIPSEEDTVASHAFKISTAAAAGTAAEILLNGKPNPASFDPQNPDNVQILALAQKLGAREGTNIDTFIPRAKEALEFHREAFDKTSGFFLQRADALLAESAKSENYGKDLIVASRRDLDALLERVREREIPKMFSFKGTIWRCSHSTGWIASCQSGMTGKVTASTWKELQACIRSAVLSKSKEGDG
jgi:hypothetical protein